MFENYKKQYEQIWKMFIRPYRQTYYIYELGPTTQILKGRYIKRHDLDIKNSRNLILKCSYFEILDNISTFDSESKPDYNSHRPCLIYLHCNATSRLEALQLLPYLSEANINLFCFDFSGCGLSEGDYISLGVYEAEDLKSVVEFLRRNFGVKHIGLWGRSMGAVTALRYAATDNRISCMLCDSPFSDLRKLALDYAKEHSKVPSFLIKGALTFVKRSIKKRANFNIKDLDQTKLVKKCLMPVIFVTSKEDSFVKSWHIEKLFDLYAGEKKLIFLKGDHNGDRPNEFYKDISRFFKENLEHKHLNVHLSIKEFGNNEIISNKGINNKNIQEIKEEGKRNESKLGFWNELSNDKKDKDRYKSIERKHDRKEEVDDYDNDDFNERRKSMEGLGKWEEIYREKEKRKELTFPQFNNGNNIISYTMETWKLDTIKIKK